MVGDAFAFIDPVFSSGVHLALNSGTVGAGVVDAFLRGVPNYADLQKSFEVRVRRGINTFSWFIHRFNQPAFEVLSCRPGVPQRLNAQSCRCSPETCSTIEDAVPPFPIELCHYLFFVLNWKENWAVARRRKQGSRTTMIEVSDYAVKTT